jgi:hypothetical protein
MSGARSLRTRLASQGCSSRSRFAHHAQGPPAKSRHRPTTARTVSSRPEKTPSCPEDFLSPPGPSAAVQPLFFPIASSGPHGRREGPSWGSISGKWASAEGSGHRNDSRQAAVAGEAPSWDDPQERLPRGAQPGMEPSAPGCRVAGVGPTPWQWRPAPRSRPAYMTASCWAICAITPRSWVIMSTAVPTPAGAPDQFEHLGLDVTSRAVVGSSASMRLGGTPGRMATERGACRR